jgi:hypothetical protein
MFGHSVAIKQLQQNPVILVLENCLPDRLARIRNL